MAHQSLYRRFRPERFDDHFVGQTHVVRALQNAVAQDRVGHAYLFSGPRGTGKTTMARVLARALNCENVSDGQPCGECESCTAIGAGTSLDVHELDAASNNSVEDIRSLVASAALGNPGRRKVYVLDEVHMLSKAASNALLKTLEEPPDHVVFVLATTDPQKVLPTIRSRTQHFEFRLLPASELSEHVRWVMTEVGMEPDEAVVDHVVTRGAGSVRDTLSALDQVLAAGGVADQPMAVDDLVSALAARDTGAALAAVAAAASAGTDARDLGESLTRHLRDVFLVSIGVQLDELPEDLVKKLAEQAGSLGTAAAVRAMEAVGRTLVEMRQANDPRLLLEVALVQLCEPTLQPEVVELAARVDELERRLSSAPAAGTSVPGISAPGTSAPGNERAQPPPTRASKEAAGEPSPAAAARAALAETRESSRSGSDSPSPAAEERSESASPAPPPPPPPAPTPRAVPMIPSTDTPSGDAPVAGSDSGSPSPSAANPAGVSRDQLTLDWGNDVLARLSPRARALYSAGRFVAAEGARAAFAVPNGPHMAKCETLRRDVEAVLESHYGQPVELVLMVEGEDVPPLGAPEHQEEPEEIVDVDDLVDAPDQGDPVSRLQAAFPGAKLVEPGPEQ